MTKYTVGMTKYTVVDQLPDGHVGRRRPGSLERHYHAAIDAACEAEGWWVRVDSLASSSHTTAKGRAQQLRDYAHRYSRRTGLAGFAVTVRQDDHYHVYIRKDRPS